jgi:hypothetical protein
MIEAHKHEGEERRGGSEVYYNWLFSRCWCVGVVFPHVKTALYDGLGVTM